MGNKTNIWNKNHNEEKECIICNNKFRIKWSHLERRKCCSKKCKNVFHSILMSGEKNPQFG